MFAGVPELKLTKSTENQFERNNFRDPSTMCIRLRVTAFPCKCCAWSIIEPNLSWVSSDVCGNYHPIAFSVFPPFLASRCWLEAYFRPRTNLAHSFTRCQLPLNTECYQWGYSPEALGVRNKLPFENHAKWANIEKWGEGKDAHISAISYAWN